MRIEKISQFKGSTLQIDFSEIDPVFVHRDIVFEFNLSEGMNIPKSAVEDILRANELRKAKERALYLLDNRDYSYTELFERLEKNYDEDICFEVMAKMTELGVINDKRYAKKLAEHFCAVKKYGYYRAKQEMKLRGISGELAEEALFEYSETSLNRLCELVEKKYSRYLTDEKGILKVKNALVRLGYSYDEINAVIDEYI